MSKSNFVVIQDWMSEELGLSGTDLIIYAVIYGFTQDGMHTYHGTSKYLTKFCGVRTETVIRTLARMVEKGVLIKQEKEINGVRYCDYVAVVPEKHRGGTESVPGYDESSGGMMNHHKVHDESSWGDHDESSYHNIYKDNKRDNTPSNKLLPPRGLEGLEAAIAEHPEYEYLVPAIEQWLEYKKARKERYKTKQSLVAFIKRLDEFSDGSAETAQKVIEQSMANDWQGVYELQVRKNRDDDIPKGPKIFHWETEFKPGKPL